MFHYGTAGDVKHPQIKSSKIGQIGQCKQWHVKTNYHKAFGRKKLQIYAQKNIFSKKASKSFQNKFLGFFFVEKKVLVFFHLLNTFELLELLNTYFLYSLVKMLPCSVDRHRAS